jgi:hypothetical protein
MSSEEQTKERSDSLSPAKAQPESVSPPPARTLSAGSTTERQSIVDDVAERIGDRTPGYVLRSSMAMFARELESARPVEVMLRDPLSDVARRERRSLLGISAVAILVGTSGLIPQKIENLGITFSIPEQTALLRVFTAVVVYYVAAFLIYAMGDALRYAHAIYRGTEELRAQFRRQVAERGVPGALKLESAMAAGLGPEVGDPSWRLIRLVRPASVVRFTFDFVAPLAIAGYAIYALLGATPATAKLPSPSPAASVPIR